MSPLSEQPPEQAGPQLRAEASGKSTVYQAGRDQHFHYQDGVRRRRRAAPGTVVDRCPYPGLDAFGPEQAPWFFGRDRLIGALIDRLDRRRQTGGVQVVVAPSGAGKSSLLRAGLLPSLEDGALDHSAHWPRTVFTPTATPLRALAAHLGPIISSRTGADLAGDPERCLPMLAEALLAADGPDAAARAVIVVDQFEELFTLCADESQRAAFINLLTLLAAPAPPLAYVVIGLRADFYADCAHYPQLRAALEDRQLVVGAMSPDELRETIIYPARDVGLDVDEGLTELLLSDLGAVGENGAPGYEAGRLPLLAHALRRTWQGRSGTTLTVAAYQDIGGIRGALADTAEQAFTALDAAGRDAARLLFLRLVRIGDGRTEDTRQRLTHAEAVDGAPDPRTAEAVVDAFTRERLLTRQHDPASGSDTVEITHEALLGGWPRLRDWINQDRAGLLIRQQLTAANEDWIKSGRDPSALYRGTRLAVARDWAADGASPGGLDAGMDEFLRASVELEESERRAVRRRTRRLRLLAGALAVLLVAALATAWVAIDQGRTLTERNRTIGHQRDVAVADRVAGEAVSQRLLDPVKAKQLAVAAASIAPGAHATGRALVTLYHQPELYTYRPEDVDWNWVWSLDSTGRTAAAAALLGHEVKIVDVDQRKVTRTITLTGEPIAKFNGVVSLSGDGRAVAVKRQDDTVGIWDTATGRPWPVTIRVPATDVMLNATGTRLLSSQYSPDRVKVWDTSTGRLILEFRQQLMNSPAIFTRDGGQLIRANGARLEWWDLDTGRKARSPLLVLEGGPIVGLAVSPDGNVVAARQSSHQGVRIIHLDKIGKSHRIGRHRLDDLAFGVRRYGDASELGLAFSSDGRYVRAGGSILDLDQLSRDEVWRSGTRNCVGDVVFGPEDRTLRCARDGITVLSLGAFRNPVQLISEFSSKAVTSADGTTLAVWHRDYRGVEIWDPIKRTLRGTLPIFEAGWRSAGRFELSEDGRLLAYLHTGGDIDIWDVDSATKKTTLKTGHKLSHNTPAAFSPDGRTLAVAALSGDVSQLDLWDVPSGTRRATSAGEPSGVILFPLSERTRILFSRDGRTVVSASDQGVVDVATGRRLLDLGTELPHPMALSANGVLADVARDNMLTLYEDQTYQRRTSAHIDIGAPRWMRFSPDGNILAIAETSSGRIQLWHVPSKSPYGPALTGFPRTEVQTLAFTPDGSTVLALDDEGRLRTHLIAPDRIKAALCAQFGPLSEADWKIHLPEIPYRKTC